LDLIGQRAQVYKARGRERRRDGRDLVAETTGSLSSSRLMSLVGAHALVRIPPGDQGIKARSIVDAPILSLP